MRSVVIVGAGQGGTAAAESLRECGFDGAVALVDASPELPYRRPPLSKAFLSGDLSRDALAFRPASFYDRLDIDLLLGDSVTSIDQGRKRIELAGGRLLYYGHLIIATGSTPRPWGSDGVHLDGVFQLASIRDAERLRDAMRPGAALTVIGGGFIGLEVASTATAAGLDVTVLETADRVMGRTLSAYSSALLTERHRARGVSVRTSVAVDAIVGAAGKVTGVRLRSGQIVPSDLVLVGVGSSANVGPFAARLLDGSSGALAVDELLRTADPAISAIGDVAAFPRGGRSIRLESVQNATDQARTVAARLTGEAAPYAAVPWFWTEQAGVKVQMAGLVAGADRHILRGDVDSGRFSVFAFHGEELLGAESFSKPADHIAVRSLLAQGRHLRPEQAEDEEFSLTAFARESSRTAA